MHDLLLEVVETVGIHHLLMTGEAAAPLELGDNILAYRSRVTGPEYDAVGEEDCLLQIVRNQKDGYLRGVDDADHQFLHLPFRFRI